MIEVKQVVGKVMDHRRQLSDHECQNKQKEKHRRDQYRRKLETGRSEPPAKEEVTGTFRFRSAKWTPR